MRISIKRPNTESTTVKLQYTIDNPNLKIVKAVLENRAPVILWQGKDYDEIGQWTEEDVQNKLAELFPQLTIS